MNKKFHETEIIGGIGIHVMHNESNQSSVYVNGEYMDFHKTITTIALDPFTVSNQIQAYITGMGQPILESMLQKIVKDKIRFGIVSWPNVDGTPVVTCQIFFNDKLIAEKTVESDDEHQKLNV